MKICPSCAEEIQDLAIICKHCGRDLKAEPPEVAARKRVDLARELARLEKNLAEAEGRLANSDKLAQDAKGEEKFGCGLMVVGAFLVPAFGLGLLILIPGFVLGVTSGKKRKKAAQDRSNELAHINSIRGQIVEVKTGLASLP